MRSRFVIALASVGAQTDKTDDFIRAEMKVLQARDPKTKSAALGRSAKYVGTLMKCPRCSLISIIDLTGNLSKLYESKK